MKKMILLFVLAFCATNVIWSQTPANEDSEESVRQLIKEKVAKMEVWLLEEQLDSLLANVGDDIIQMPPHQEPTEGIAAFEADWQQSFAMGDWDFDFEVQEIKVSGDLAVEKGKYTLDFTPGDSAPMPAFNDRGTYLAVWEKIDNDWKMVWDAPVSSKTWRELIPEIQRMQNSQTKAMQKKK